MLMFRTKSAVSKNCSRPQVKLLILICNQYNTNVKEAQRYAPSNRDSRCATRSDPTGHVGRAQYLHLPAFAVSLATGQTTVEYRSDRPDGGLEHQSRAAGLVRFFAGRIVRRPRATQRRTPSSAPHRSQRAGAAGSAPPTGSSWPTRHGGADPAALSSSGGPRGARFHRLSDAGSPPVAASATPAQASQGQSSSPSGF